MGGVPLENQNEVLERGMGKLYDIISKAKADRAVSYTHLTLPTIRSV